MNPYCKPLSLPKIPADLLVLDHQVLSCVDIGYGLTHVKNGKQLEPIKYIRCQPTHEPLIQWLLTHIPGIQRKDIMLLISRHSTGGYHIIHSDKGRSWRLNYFLESGGNNVTTTWYQEKNKPLRRFKTQGWQQSDSAQQVHYDDCIPLRSQVLDTQTWYAFNGDVLHDSGPIVGDRVFLSINTEQDYNDI